MLIGAFVVSVPVDLLSLFDGVFVSSMGISFLFRLVYPFSVRTEWFGGGER